jgi:hypothetical protein
MRVTRSHSLVGGLACRAEAVGLTCLLRNLSVRYSALGQHDDAFPAKMQVVATRWELVAEETEAASVTPRL